MTDFVIEIAGDGGDYHLKVESPAGEAQRASRLGLELTRERLGILQSMVLASASTTRARTSDLERSVREIGQEMYDAVFGGQTASLYFASRQQAEQRGEPLRTVLRIGAPELASMPWELLFDEGLGGYLGLREPMVRYVELMEPVAPLTVAPPLRILGMTALPGGMAVLDAASEQRNLETALRPLIDDGRVHLSWVSGQTWNDLQDRLIDGCHVFHFIGHGGFDTARGEGMVAFADEGGGEQRMYATSLARLLSTARPAPRLVVLNTCRTAAGSAQDLFSSTASILVRTMPAVVAMQFEITDGAAKVFSRALYQAMARNRPIDEAVRIARIAVSSAKDETLEWATPVLYLRSTDGRLFDLAQASPGAVESGGSVSELRLAATAAYWSGRWEDAVRLLGTLRLSIPGDAEVEEMLRRSRLGLRYQQGREAEQSGDWAAAAAHFQAVVDGDAGYEDATVRLGQSRRRDEVARLERQLRELSAAGQWQAVIGVGDRLASIDPDSADPDGLVTKARELVGVEAPPTSVTEDEAAVEVPQAGEDRLVRTFGVGQWVRCLAYSPDGGRLAAGMRRRVSVFDPASGALRWTEQFGGWTDSVVGVTFSPDGRSIATASGDLTGRIWSVANGKQRAEVRHHGVVTAVAFSPDGLHLATASEDQSAAVWDATTQQQIFEVRHGGVVNSVSYSPDGLRIISSGADGWVRVWDSATGEEAGEIPGGAFGAIYTPDGSRLLATGPSNDETGFHLRAWDAATNTQLLDLPLGGVAVLLAVSPDSRLVATAGPISQVQLFDIPTGRQVLAIDHENSAQAVAFSPDGRHLATGSDDKAIRVWSIEDLVAQ